MSHGTEAERRVQSTHARLNVLYLHVDYAVVLILDDYRESRLAAVAFDGPLVRILDPSNHDQTDSWDLRKYVEISAA